jgi:uncharacterized protein
MRILCTSDLHGEIGLYEQILNAAKGAGVEALILGGDLLPTLQKTRRYEEMIPEQRIFIRDFLFPFFRNSLKSLFRRIFLIPGNWDPAYPEIFEDAREGLVDLDRRKFRFENGYELIGYPFVPPTPFRPKDYEKMDDRESLWPPQKNPSYVRSAGKPYVLEAIDPKAYLAQRGTIAEDLKALPPAEDPRRTVYVMHSPPLGTKLDMIPGGHFVGSRSIRKFIESSQPLLTLHGHIHEAPRLSGSYADRIGRTLCANPGQLLSEDEGGPALQAVIFDLEAPDETLRHTHLNTHGA